jgi:hypothetical protein
MIVALPFPDQEILDSVVVHNAGGCFADYVEVDLATGHSLPASG